MKKNTEIEINNSENHVDAEIHTCLNLDDPKSFFLFAGAGSGKTRTLVNALKAIRQKNGHRLHLSGQRIAVITYTNAACDEIKSRIDYDPLFSVSTIHSFVWDLINNFHSDIKKWLQDNLSTEIKDLKIEHGKGNPNTKTAVDRVRKIEAKQKRLENLHNIKKFTYNPNGENNSRDSLNHSEVIGIGAYFLTNKTLMQSILIRKYPILLIDESQDTNKFLLDAFFKVQKENSNHFLLGLFGDTMQRIYTDGKINLGEHLPDDWAKPAKKMNYRCPSRIIKLINKIRHRVDGHEQQAIDGKDAGIVRLFILPTTTKNKLNAENDIVKKMAEITKDNEWIGSDSNIKILILEHHMAAIRMGFFELFEPLYKIDKLKTGLLDGSNPGLRLFTQLILPLVKATQSDDKFSVARLVRQSSSHLRKNTLEHNKDNQTENIKKARDSVNELMSLWENGNNPRFVDVLRIITKTKLFDIPDCLLPIAFRTDKEQKAAEAIIIHETGKNENNDIELEAWDRALMSPFKQIEAYDAYVSRKARFETHQGVKGLEFPRVMVIIDDNEARGFLFSYEKLFGAKEATSADFKNKQEGKDNSFDRTRRLFYVICSRAEKSLAIVAYTESPQAVKKFALSEGWFEENEICVM